ncbi:hypothetical protein L207DRAFT_563751 [Hyaloscypha variabilis F]|uniref:Peptidase S1 domain-containing protein n=1 Tax=Hyaloscypha variabilis (strain UAMH 11265 / GT02V1 / F) TaxID=1149755 RepID=A0A2J6RWP8_HYAVF|nr:hypothetical protein L207DRAFT_563751 [Hyaloscypha variabilis F]
MADDERRDQVGELPPRASPSKGRRQNPSSSSSESWASGTTASSSGSSFAPPAEEINFYFQGLAGEPRLLARSSTETFQRKYDGTFPMAKMVFNVGRHPIVTGYDKGPRFEIRAVLKGVKWIKIDIVRLGYAITPAENPVVVLITVDKGTVPFWKAHDVVQNCRQVLLKYNLDIHVEMMESDKISLGFFGETPLPIYPYQRIPFIGQSIGPTVSGPHQASGTLGLYVTLKKPNGGSKLCGITCHHVVFPSRIQDPPGGFNKHFLADSTKAAFFVDQPSTQDHDATMNHLREGSQAYQQRVDQLLSKQRDAEEGIGRPLSQKQENDLSVYRGVLQKHNQHHNTINNFSRRFGSVSATSGIYTDETYGNTVDWALVDIDQQRFNQLPHNQLPDMNFTEDQIRSMNSKLHIKDWYDPEEFKGTIQTTHIPLQDIRDPKVKDKDGFPSLRVLKYGRTTHWTVGISNEVLSDCQRENGIISKEWCVIDDNLHRGGRFSDRGDSGAMVFDYHGHLAGMIHGGGVPKASGKQMTYVTPIEWVFQNIERTLGVEVYFHQ